MSVINRVLKDLDRQGAAVFVPDGVRPVATSPDRKSRRPLWLLLGTVLSAGLAVWQFWPQPRSAAINSRPLALIPTPDGATAPATTLVPAVSAAPATAAVIKTLHPPPDLLPSGPPMARVHPAEPTSASPPSPAPVARLTGQMATRLSVAVDVPKVVKENRSATPAEQAAELFRQASRLIEQGRSREAQASLDEALRLEPGHAGARQTLAVLLMEAGDSTRAESLLKQGMSLQANDLWYPRSLAQLYLQRGDSEQALATLKTGLDKAGDANYWGFYAAVLNKLGRHDETAQAYRQATHLDPGHGPWWLGLAVALEKAGHNSEAAEAYRHALQTRLSTEVREFAAQKSQELGK